MNFHNLPGLDCQTYRLCEGDKTHSSALTAPGIRNKDISSGYLRDRTMGNRQIIHKDIQALVLLVQELLSPAAGQRKILLPVLKLKETHSFRQQCLNQLYGQIKQPAFSLTRLKIKYSFYKMSSNR